MFDTDVDVYEIKDFEGGGLSISTKWLASEVSSLRRILLGGEATVSGATFSKWRKHIGVMNSEKIFPLEAVAIVFLASYPKMSRYLLNVPMTQIPQGPGVMEHVRKWLQDIAVRRMMGKQTKDDAAVYNLLKAIEMPFVTLGALLEADRALEPSKRRMVSLRTLQRRASRLGLELYMDKPIPTPLLKDLYN